VAAKVSTAARAYEVNLGITKKRISADSADTLEAIFETGMGRATQLVFKVCQHVRGTLVIAPIYPPQVIYASNIHIHESTRSPPLQTRTGTISADECVSKYVTHTSSV
jgi:hypothetical protein